MRKVIVIETEFDRFILPYHIDTLHHIDEICCNQKIENFDIMEMPEWAKAPPPQHTEDDIRDTAIAITDMLVKAGLVPDCTDSDDPTEFGVQDTIVDIITKKLGGE